MKEFSSVMNESDLSLEELRKAFNSLERNKSAGIDEINVNIVKSVYDLVEAPLLLIFNLSLKQGIFPDQLKVARIVPIFKTGSESKMSNYRPISILPCFSKILERIMYNRLYAYIESSNILYKKQFGFQKNHSTEHAVVKLVDEILTGFDKNEYTLGVFIDLSKAFDTVDHEILLSKLEYYGVKNNNLKWFKNYLTNRKQSVSYDHNHSNLLSVTCGVPQGSILGSLLFLLYINDLHTSSNILNFILFADDTNLFYSHKNIKTLFSTMNIELIKIDEWFRANKLSLNIDKTKYTLFAKQYQSNILPLRLPSLSIANINIKREYSMKFLGVILDEHLSWKEHIRTIENKISKNLGVMYKCKYILNAQCLKLLYYSFIHSYINYCNLAWASTNITKLNKIYGIQKHASRIIMNENRSANAKPLLKGMRVLNVYQMNIYKHLIFMHNMKFDKCPKAFENQFSNINHKYNTRYSKNNFNVPKSKLRQTDFSITSRGPKLWNSILTIDLKTESSFTIFRTLLKCHTLDIDNDMTYF